MSNWMCVPDWAKECTKKPDETLSLGVSVTMLLEKISISFYFI